MRNKPLSYLQISLAYIGFMKIHSFSYFFVGKKELSFAKVSEMGLFWLICPREITKLLVVQALWQIPKKKAPGWYPRTLKLKLMLLI